MEHQITLSFDRPPLSLNDRFHWSKKARITRAIRDEVAWRCRHITQTSHVTVCLHWSPRDNRRRDADNPAPTEKACFDGLVDAGVVADDTPEFMTKQRPVIEKAGQTPSCWLTITTGTEGDTK